MKHRFCNYFWKTLEEAFSPDRESLNQASVREAPPDPPYSSPSRSAPELGLQGPPQSAFIWGGGGGQRSGQYSPLPKAPHQWPASLCQQPQLLVPCASPDRSLVKYPFIKECVCFPLGPHHALDSSEAAHHSARL